MTIANDLYKILRSPCYNLREPESADTIEKAYLKLVPVVVGEDWTKLMQMQKDEANSVLKNSFLYAPFFAKQFLEQIEDNELRNKLETEFLETVGDTQAKWKQ